MNLYHPERTSASRLLVLFANILLIPAAIFGQTGPVTSVQSPPFRLDDGTPVKLRLTETVSSASARVGDRVDFEAVDEVKVNGIVVIRKGAMAWGTVTKARPKRRLGRGGKLDVTIDGVRLADGQKAMLRAVKDTKGGGHAGAMTGAMVATSIVFFPAAPLFLFMHGKNITIPEGTEINAYINGGMDLNPARFTTSPLVSAFSASSSPSTSPPAVAETVSSCRVVVRSEPDGANITIDGKYMGSTPSTLDLAPGTHVVTIYKTGFKTWQRTITVTAGSQITVDASLF
jgi:hypothetical protein